MRRGLINFLSCLRRRGVSLPAHKPSYSTTSISRQSSLAIAPLPHRRLLSLSGLDAAKFLQGLITNNVDPAHQASFYSAFLDARGRVLWDVFIWVWPELVAQKGQWACYIEVDEGELGALKKHLKKHKLRSKVEIEDVSGEGEKSGDVRVWAAWGALDEMQIDKTVITMLNDPRAPSLRRLLAPANNHEITAGAEPLDTEAYRMERYKLGIPEGPHEITRESALPMECNLDLSRGIDFKKGCYVGQELTIRTKHTGVVRKRILPVTLLAPNSALTAATPERGADIRALDENGDFVKGRAVGKFVASIGTVGLSLCRLENMTSMKVSAEGGSWKPGVQFGIETSDGIFKVKPVLHDWFVLREREMWDRNRTRI